MMRRERSESFEKTAKPLDIAKCLMMLSRTFAATEPKMVTDRSVTYENTNHFECKTCNRKFQSFQALGGHRASHNKRPRSESSDQDQEQQTKKHINNDKQRHECSICGQSFGSGQALGGHMRRHRTTLLSEPRALVTEPPARTLYPTVHGKHVLKRCNSSKRVFSLDLNLTPLENDLEYVFGKALVPKIDMKFVS
ncbi:PREDICTED: zinc finger protein ZAT11-like [Tarenaya hassleriana]|uniref:zinc finger protein ZAT11-like n=1 Tax=Tarenaya hassleriana TaxID=28532 RepID=UPI00053C918B|nr:PREDICTED: zinc finger protein ZAT11-like [Tarenaya hassleriana]